MLFRYIQEVAGGDSTAKNLRTCHGTVCTVQTLRKLGEVTSHAEVKHQITQSVKAAAEHLGNTPTGCRETAEGYYISSGCASAIGHKAKIQPLL
jgi:DNA topoisomerase-1